MAQYIDKTALVAEIEKIIEEPAPSHDSQCRFEDGYYGGLYKAESIIDAIEVKDVDLKKEVEAYRDTFYWDEDLYKFAKHFFELGLAQKGE